MGVTTFTQDLDAFVLAPKCLPWLDNWSLWKPVEALEGRAHLEEAGDSEEVGFVVYSLAPFPAFIEMGVCCIMFLLWHYSHTMAARHDELHLQTRSQNKPSSLELLVRYFIIHSSKDCTGLPLLREYFQLCPSLSSIFSFCSATKAIQNITAQCGALCTERSPTARHSCCCICILPW